MPRRTPPGLCGFARLVTRKKYKPRESGGRGPAAPYGRSVTTPASSSSPALQAYARHVDGLFTYCLSVLCEHDAATAAVAEVRDLALRHGARLAEPKLRRAWLYALARHACLDRLERGLGPVEARPNQAQADQRQRELASLAWPEAAGTDPEQREALELAVRHRLSTPEVAAVLGCPVEAAEALLAGAGAEIGRTRTALLVLGVGSCPELAQLGGVGAESRRGWVLGPALRRELVQHVVDCPTCRGTAERVSGELGTDLAALPGLPLVAAPVTVRVGGTPAGQLPGGSAGAAFLAGAAAGRRAVAPGAGARPEPRFDQRGFPRHRAPSSGRALAARQRTVATGVLAAVLAAPVVAMWAAHRSGGTPSAAASVSSVRVGTEPHRGPAPAPVLPPAPLPAPPPAAELQLAGAVTAETSPGPRLPMLQGPAVPVPSKGATVITSPTLASTFTPPPVAPPAPGRLTVEAGEYGNRTVITLTNSGGTALQWSAVADVDWLRLSRDSGTLEPGQRITVTVTVDDQRVPQGHWTATITLSPGDSVVTVEGGPSRRDGGGTPSAAPSSSPTPAPTGSTSPTPSPSPTPTGTPSPSGTPSATPSPHPSTTPSSSPSPTAGPTS